MVLMVTNPVKDVPKILRFRLNRRKKQILKQGGAGGGQTFTPVGNF